MPSRTVGRCPGPAPMAGCGSASRGCSIPRCAVCGVWGGAQQWNAPSSPVRGGPSSPGSFILHPNYCAVPIQVLMAEVQQPWQLELNRPVVVSMGRVHRWEASPPLPSDGFCLMPIHPQDANDRVIKRGNMNLVWCWGSQLPTWVDKTLTLEPHESEDSGAALVNFLGDLQVRIPPEMDAWVYITVWVLDHACGIGVCEVFVTATSCNYCLLHAHCYSVKIHTYIFLYLVFKPLYFRAISIRKLNCTPFTQSTQMVAEMPE